MDRKNSSTLCAVPFIQTFSAPSGGWRNCCAADPQIRSNPGQTFDQWWTSKDMQDFRSKFGGTNLPSECQKCSMHETTYGHSLRLSVNKTVGLNTISVTYPSRWSIIFGNVCNLACWSCGENSSSVIEKHKQKLKLLPDNFESTQKKFQQQWPDIKANILKSYQYHKIITLTLLGGEPLYNKDVLQFLDDLRQQGLSHRTTLEFHTNATRFTRQIQKILSTKTWNYISMFLSLDAVGKKAEWLRYGCNWSKICNNISGLKQLCNYVEVHCTLSVLNIRDLVDLQKFCNVYELPLKINLLVMPRMMSIKYWDGDKELLLRDIDQNHHDFGNLYKLVGSSPILGNKNLLVDYIRSFDAIRKPLSQYDDCLASILGL